MSKLHFYLEQRNGKADSVLKRDCPVILSFSFSSSRIKVYTGRKIRESEWEKSKEKANPVYTGSSEINAYLDLVRKRVENYCTEAQETGKIIDVAQFRSEVKKMVKSEVPLFFNLLLRFIDENNNKWSVSTYKKMKTFYSQLKDYSLVQNEVIVTGMINREFADSLVQYYRLKGLKDTSIRKNLDLLKWFMNWSLREKLIFNRDYQQIRFVPATGGASSNIFFLKWEEVSRFYSIDGLTKKEEWCRDIFCFIAFTGIRYSQICKLKKEHVKGRYAETGTDGNKKVLLNRFSTELCKKYEIRFYRNNSLFPLMSLITFHKYLRSAAQKAQLDRYVYAVADVAELKILHKVICAQSAINTYFAHTVRLDISDRNSSTPNSSRSRIANLSGSLKIAEEKELLTSDQLYESIKSSGPRP